jgi:hypothetical protein
VNIAITPTAETLIQQLIELGHDTPESIVEQALQYFYAQQSIDTSLGFPDLSEAAIIQENEQRWKSFQQLPDSIAQAEVEAQFCRTSSPVSL